MKISELCHSLERIKKRFGDLEVRAGRAAVMHIAVLPNAAADNNLKEQQDMTPYVALLTREHD